ncbi:hypothetical protein MAR_011569 [Mya arenaria]|uniref:Uncharacterized protein n=1 Tax=Mya arenaria TaxID=6604 RepID=A0ABY7FUJ6_MYAAR|nr:hypothetical protein MAR_011569 [Mya arenaria]
MLQNVEGTAEPEEKIEEPGNTPAMSEPSERAPEGDPVDVTGGEQQATNKEETTDGEPAQQEVTGADAEQAVESGAEHTQAETTEPESQPENTAETDKPNTEPLVTNDDNIDETKTDDKDADDIGNTKTTMNVQEKSEPTEPGESLDKAEYEKQIRENEELSHKFESALSNQEAERDAYRKLTEENARLQKHHDDMKTRYEEMERGHVAMETELADLRKADAEKRDAIGRLESEVRVLKETQGGDDNMRALQEKLIRLSDDQEKKDRTIHDLQGELDATKKRLKDAEDRAAKNGGTEGAPQSKTCVVM